MKRYLRPGLLAAVGLTAILALSSCSMLRQYLPSNAESSSSSSTSGSQQNVETHTLQGTLNQIDTDLKYLVRHRSGSLWLGARRHRYYHLYRHIGR